MESTFVEVGSSSGRMVVVCMSGVKFMVVEVWDELVVVFCGRR